MKFDTSFVTMRGNKVIQHDLDIDKLQTSIEHTTPYTPQQNGIIERGFAYLWDRVREILNKAGFKETMRKKLWAEAASTAVKLDHWKVKNKI